MGSSADTQEYLSSSFKRWADRRRSDPQLPSDAALAAQALIKQRRSKELPSQPTPVRSPRGRPALRTENTLFHLMPALSACRPHWFDDILYGSIAVAAGSSKGRLNVRPGEVWAALHMKEITVAALRQREVSERSAQAIAQAARHTIRGVEHYMCRHPHSRAPLDAFVRAEELAMAVPE